MRCAGLFMIVEPDKAVLLCARRSYNNNTHYHDAEQLRRVNFLEKISIPRGKRDGRDIFDYETAVREFIEETGTFFESAWVHRAPFVLEWNDAGVTYKYAIYVGIVKGLLRDVSREPNTYCVKLNSERPNDYKINLEVRRHNNEIPRHLYILPLQDYFQYMNEKQLTTYDSSNYLEFFEFVKRVKAQFDERDLRRFFLLSLKLDGFDLFHKWINHGAARNLVLTSNKELKKIVNVV
ncbi:P-ribose pyrophosphatase [Peridroma alphabaculovirus]|uniref:p-ribose pyrophosphatase n=1 Tax=Peridroma alphabaculovirus TaxID=1346829 RepID=A0A068LRS4_9ABAC|nr:P-ribose pyrophosphatase [Peridroma alphabaculovirus]AIE47845.1 P-ribose pyrophosphatase [Peridroma alphabaculovirus]